jgi:hypothetical protein
LSLINQESAAQALGLFAFAISLVGYTSTSDRRLKIMMTTGTLLLALHFVLFGAWLAAISLAMNTARTWLSIYRKGWRWLAFVAIVQLVVSIPLMITARDLFPVLGSLVGSYGLLCLAGAKLRLAMLVTTCCWLANNLLWGSVGAVLLDCLNASAHLYAMFRIHRATATALANADRTKDC